MLEEYTTILLKQKGELDAMQGQAMAQATAQRRKVQRQRIECALRRIESGDFGFCAMS